MRMSIQSVRTQFENEAWEMTSALQHTNSCAPSPAFAATGERAWASNWMPHCCVSQGCIVCVCVCAGLYVCVFSTPFHPPCLCCSFLFTFGGRRALSFHANSVQCAFLRTWSGMLSVIFGGAVLLSGAVKRSLACALTSCSSMTATRGWTSGWRCRPSENEGHATRPRMLKRGWSGVPWAKACCCPSFWL